MITLTFLDRRERQSKINIDRIKEMLRNKGKGVRVSVQTVNLAREFFNVILNVMQSLSLRINVQAYKCWTDDYGFEYTTLFHFEILCLVWCQKIQNSKATNAHRKRRYLDQLQHTLEYHCTKTLCVVFQYHITFFI